MRGKATHHLPEVCGMLAVAIRGSSLESAANTSAPACSAAVIVAFAAAARIVSVAPSRSTASCAAATGDLTDS